MIDETAFVHGRAHVDQVTIGPRTKVWQFASVTRGTVIGADCTIAPFALLDGAHLGDRTIFSMYAAAGPGFVIGSDVFIGPGVIFANDAWPRANKDGFDAKALRDGSLVIVRVGDGASIGAGVIILPGHTIGEGAMVAAGVIVDRDVPAHSILTRAGEIVAIDPSRTPRRMKAAAEL